MLKSTCKGTPSPSKWGDRNPIRRSSFHPYGSQHRSFPNLNLWFVWSIFVENGPWNSCWSYQTHTTLECLSSSPLSEDHWKSLKVLESHWKSLKVIESPWKSLKVIENNRQSLKIIHLPLSVRTASSSPHCCWTAFASSRFLRAWMFGFRSFSWQSTQKSFFSEYS